MNRHLLEPIQTKSSLKIQYQARLQLHLGVFVSILINNNDLIPQDYLLYLRKHHFYRKRKAYILPIVIIAHQIVLLSTNKRDFLMNLEEYLSFVSLSLAQTEQKRQNENNASVQDCLNMSEQEKFYHYITLKRWMADYQKNVPQSQGNHCECQNSSMKSKISWQEKGQSCQINGQGTPMQIQQKNTKKGPDINQGPNILFLFFKHLQHRFKHDGKEIARIMRKLKLKTSLEEFKVWLQANIPTSLVNYSAQSTKCLMNSTKNKQQSLFLRVLLRKYLKNEAFTQLLTLKDNNQTSLKDNLLDLRSIEEQLFQENK